MQEKFACSPTERLGLATTLYGTVTLSFVIPSEAEGSAVFQVYNHPLLRANRAASMRFAAPSLLIASDK
jgi:hypothetical protein